MPKPKKKPQTELQKVNALIRRARLNRQKFSGNIPLHGKVWADKMVAYWERRIAELEELRDKLKSAGKKPA